MLFTSESVTSGHPDKICDQLSDTALDAYLAGDSQSKVAIDFWVKNNTVGVIGEVTSKTKVDLPKLIRKKICDIGYNRPELGFDGNTCEVVNLISEQSVEINQAVTHLPSLGAGDQGLMFGYACLQTPELMPLPIIMAHRLAQSLELLRLELEKGKDYTIRPDGKTQVTIAYKNNVPQYIDTILISTQHSVEVSGASLSKLLTAEVINKVLDQNAWSKLFSAKTKVLINPSGSFVLGGPVADSGLTGRKIIVDSYGGWSRVGGGAFSGKDPSKVDRSAAYTARYLARQVVQRGWGSDCEIQLSYAIGKPEPVSLMVVGQLNRTSEWISRQLYSEYDLTPKGMITKLNLLGVKYATTACYGHFGRVASATEFTWES